MAKYTVKDLFTNDIYPANTLQDIEQAVEYITSHDDLTSFEHSRLDEFYFTVAEQGYAFSRALGLEVIPHV